VKITRRGFLITSGVAGAGLGLGFLLSDKKPFPHTVEGSFQPNAWLQILPNGDVIFQLDKAEMGQGVMTSLTTMAAEELDFEPEKIRIEMAGVHADYKNTAMATQITGGSTSVATTWAILPHAGATARTMLIEAAAKQWNVSANDCSTEPGVVINGKSGERLSYAELADAASQLKVPKNVQLKEKSEYRWLGKSIKRLDTRDKVLTQAEFGIDVDMPGLKAAVIARCPHFGGSVKSFNPASVKDKPGVIAVGEMHSGVAIVAETYWQARTAANGLEVEWNKGPLAGLDLKAIRQQHEKAIEEQEPYYFVESDDTDAAIEAADDSKVVQADYGAPYFHHSPMEPQNSTALYKDGKMEIWSPNQAPEIARAVAVHFTGLPHEDITLNTTLMGGGFGRRGYTDYVGEVAAIAKMYPGVPVKLVWSREDDMQHDYYRPASFHKLSASLNDEGMLDAWHHKIVSNSIAEGFCVELLSGVLPPWVPVHISRAIGKKVGDWSAGVDPSIADGAITPYTTSKKSVGIIHHDPGIPSGFWRSVGHSFNGFVIEGFMDEMAILAGKDPLQFRLDHLGEAPRLKGTLEKVRELSGWDEKKAGVFKGVAVHESFASYVAQVVEVVEENGKAKIQKVYCVADVGFALNPEIVKDQLVGGVVYGLTAALKAPVNIEDGRVVGSNFHDMPVLRANECPEIEVALIESLEDPTGVGEIAVPPIAPALGNALYAFNGKRQRELPFTL